MRKFVLISGLVFSSANGVLLKEFLNAGQYATAFALTVISLGCFSFCANRLEVKK